MRWFHMLPDPQGDGWHFGDALRDVVEGYGYDAIVACDDPTLARLSWLEWPLPAVPQTGPPFLALTDKLALSELAARAGIDYPRTFVTTTGDQLRIALDATGLPAVVKARRSATALPERVLYAKGAVVVRDHAAALAAVESFVAQGFHPIVQQRVFTNKKLNAVIIRRAGRSELRYAHRVLREIPSVGGTGITLQTVPLDDPDASEAVRALEAVCDCAGYEGLAQAELYLDPEDGRAWLIDVNPRPWGSTWFVEKLGMRVIERAVRAALDEPARPQPSYPAGRRFRHATSEFKWFRQEQSVFRSMVGVVRDTRRGDIYEYLDPSDLRPLFRHAVARLLRRTTTSHTFEPTADR